MYILLIFINYSFDFININIILDYKCYITIKSNNNAYKAYSLS